MPRQPKNPTARRDVHIPRRVLALAGAAGLWVSPVAVARSAPGIEIPAGESVLLSQEPAGLASFASFLPAVPGASAGIRYQIDIAWLTTESPTPGGTHDSVFFTLQSDDGSRVVPVFGVDVFGVQVPALDGFSLEIEPLATPDPLLANSLAYRVLISPPADLLRAGSWAVIDLVDTGLPGGSQARVQVALVPEPGTVVLGALGGLVLAAAWWCRNGNTSR